jgi:hypothetical protein
MEDSAVSSCSSLRSICIPSSVEKLGKDCFSLCESLSTVTFESGSKLSSIEEFAFAYCSSLSSICIPSSLKTILTEYQAFLKVCTIDGFVDSGPERDAVVGSEDWVEGNAVIPWKNE